MELRWMVSYVSYQEELYELDNPRPRICGQR